MAKFVDDNSVAKKKTTMKFRNPAPKYKIYRTNDKKKNKKKVINS